MTSTDLRARRHAAGLTARAVARAAGVSIATVLAYERGNHRNPVTLHRLVAVIRVDADSPIHRHRLVTIASAATGIRVGLRDGWSSGDLLRMVRESRSNSKFLRNDADRAAFYAQPPSTGDARWDAMLAGVTEMDALGTGHEVPPWCRGHDLPYVWFVGSTAGLRAWALAHTPPSLGDRGVIIDGDALESV